MSVVCSGRYAGNKRSGETDGGINRAMRREPTVARGKLGRTERRKETQERSERKGKKRKGDERSVAKVDPVWERERRRKNERRRREALRSSSSSVGLQYEGRHGREFLLGLWARERAK